MINIISNTIIEIDILDNMARSILGIATSGVSVSDKSIIHLLDESQSNQDKAQAILDNYNTLTVTADKTTMNEGDADPVISCNDVAISADANVNYVTLLDNEVYASGTDTVTAGLVQLTLSSPVAGVYEIFIYRDNDTFASGSITITVNEV